MSAFSGPQGKGALRRHREGKRIDAEQREADTVRVMYEQNVSRGEAQRVAKASRQMLAAKAARLGGAS